MGPNETFMHDNPRIRMVPGNRDSAKQQTPVADPVGGSVHPLGGGGIHLQRGCFLVRMHVKTKELGPVGGHAPLDPPMNA